MIDDELTVQEAAERIGVSTTYVQALVDQGQIELTEESVAEYVEGWEQAGHRAAQLLEEEPDSPRLQAAREQVRKLREERENTDDE